MELGRNTEPTGPDPDGHLRAPSVAALIEERAAVTPHATMLLDEHDRRLSFAQYSVAVSDTAGALWARGVRPGDVVGWQLPTRIETVVLMGALARLGVTQVPILPIHRERELRFMLRQSEASTFVVPGTWRGIDYTAMAEEVREELGSFHVIVADPAVEPAASDGGAGVPPPPTDGDVVRWIYYSSGTTADPKGVMHTDRAAMASGRAMAGGQGFVAADRYGLAFPFTHIGGLTNLCAVLAAGFALVLVEAFDPPRAVEVFARHGATVVGGGPAFYRAYLEQQRRQPDRPVLPHLRFMTGGGAPMPPAMHHEVRTELGGLGIAHGYGMTETCSMFAINRPDDSDDALCHTSGRVLPGMEARVVAPDGRRLPPGEVGELRVRGELLLVGYVDPTLDGEAFDADGWFRTGDLGSVDVDGYVRVTGRLKDVIIRKGENISATEIEDLLYAHPSVAEVAVVGLPDDERGELVCAVVVPEPGTALPDLAAVTAHLDAARLMRQKYPERIELVDALPRNAAGKVQKAELVRRFAPGPAVAQGPGG